MEQTAHPVDSPGTRNGARPEDSRERLAARFDAVRRTTESLVETLSPEDQNLQSMAEASPAKWHRAHTTWFFETFLLERLDPGYQSYDTSFVELFNSYYNAVGRQHPRPYRSLLSRPDADEIGRYREAVDAAVREFITSSDDAKWAEAAPVIELGTHHEQQHQELLLTDIKHAFSFNPLSPSLGTGTETSEHTPSTMRFHECPGGMTSIGAEGTAFCFDNETPRHQAWLPNGFALADRPVNCAEYLEFIEDGGYADPMLWLSDGWAWVQDGSIEAPLYWERRDDEWAIRTLAGTRRLDPAEPVCHVSFYEACAFAEWSGCRLPTEIEWEHAAAELAVTGHFADRGRFHPAAPGPAANGFSALFGDVWEWTTSAYGPYPGFEPAAGAIGEYNGKFMANQMVLRGGSCATPVDHVRATYRNFFYPPDRWQFSGIRLARDIK
ncbi:MAG: ergothioneine biosynthesis protein EgtB [Candidatus Wenzhouxiangella sp. M2_3B_020]